MKKLVYIFLITAIATLVSSCTRFEETVIQEVDVLFEMQIEGNQATFINKTEGVQSLRWEFGDGSESTSENPTHTYPGKGKYVVTLYAAHSGGKTYEASTVLNIAKTSAVKIDDNTVEDWEAVTNSIVPGDQGGIMNEMKLDYDGNYIYLYLDMDAKVADGHIFDFYIDSDNNASTGYLTGTFPEGGYDIVLEGPIFGNSLDVYYHSGAQEEFGFEVQSIANYFTIGTTSSTGNKTRFEFRIDRSRLKGLTGSAMRIGLIVNKSDWSAEVGAAPGSGNASFLLQMDE